MERCKECGREFFVDENSEIYCENCRFQDFTGGDDGRSEVDADKGESDP